MGGCFRNPASPLALLCEQERGPRGILYRAWDARSGRHVSLRVSSWPRESSLRAAARAASLDHPHIAAVLEAGWRDDAAYVIFGEELGARVNPVALTPRDAVRIVRDVATAVDYAARRGVHHPGLVPDVLRFTPHGRVAVTGYELPGAPPGPDLYLAPEVRHGAVVDAAANVYSLGAILYVLAAGSHPDTRLPEDLEPLVREAMRIDPARRPSAAALAAELTRWLSSRILPAPTRGAWKDALFVTGLLALLLLGLARPLPGGNAAPPPESNPPAPKPGPAAVVEALQAEPPKPIECPPPARVGTVKHVHPEYGVFVALEAASKVGVGDALEVVRDGSIITVLRVRRLSRPETLYPHGAAVCDPRDPVVEAGQIVRRPTP